MLSTITTTSTTNHITLPSPTATKSTHHNTTMKLQFILSLLLVNFYAAVGVDAFSTPSFTPPSHRPSQSQSQKKLYKQQQQQQQNFRGGDSTTTAIRYQSSRRLNDSSPSNSIDSDTDESSSTHQISNEQDDPLAEYIAETNLPTEVGHFRLRAYRLKKDLGEYVGSEPCVIYATHKPIGRCGVGGASRNVPIRVHDQCFTSEVFGSQRCDCKEQLVMSLKHISKHGGAIIYLQQEGRGIGLANKIAAYALQDTGFDTVDANIHLGFPEDARNYEMIPSILNDLGIESIQLMTNNPLKVEFLKNLGVRVEGTVPMVVKEVNQWNRKYIETKVERMRHENFEGLSGVKQTFMLPKLHRNGMMMPKRRTTAATRGGAIAEQDDSSKTLNINVDIDIEMEDDETSHALDANGVLAASNAITSALRNDTTTAFLPTSFQSGVRANSDGYCFGRHTVEKAIAAIARGEMVVVVDDEDRENEGDFIMAADQMTPETMAVMIRYTSGVICVAMEGERMDALELPPMVVDNQDPKGTAFTVSVDATKEHGITTGISATERSKTIQLLSSPHSTATDFHRPGHIFPLRSQPNGVLARDGHTEASVDLSRLAGCQPVGVLSEIVSEDHPTEMMRLPELKTFCAKHGFVLTSIADIQQYRRDTETEKGL